MITDVLIAGAGPAGLTAALVLARAGRRVVVLDGGPGRNAPAAHSYGVFTRDGTSPGELRRVGRAQAEHYGATFLRTEETHADAGDAGVTVRLADGTALDARRLLLATGVVDEVPDIPGMAEAWGETAVHCPYCHGHELRGCPTVVLARGPRAVHLAGLLRGWTDRITVVPDDPDGLAADERAAIEATGATVHDGRVARLDVNGRDVRAVVFETGERLDATAVYVAPPQHLRGALPATLGLALTEANPATFTPPGLVAVDTMGRTSVAGVWACGDMAAPMQSVTMAVASGSMAAAWLNHDLIAAGVHYAP